MKIILVNQWYPPETGFGGVAMYDYSLAHELARLGHRVSVVAARWSEAVPREQRDGAVKVYRILSKYPQRLSRLPGVGRQMRGLHQWLYSQKVARKLRELERVERPDVVEVAEINGEGYAYLRESKRAPVVVRCHTPTFVLRDYYLPAEMPYSTRVTAAMEMASIRAAEGLSAPSRDMAETIGRKMGFDAGRFCVIPNGLDTRVFAPSAQERGARAEIRILHVGRFDRVKGIEVLAKAIPSVVERVPRARFVFAGNGPERYQNEIQSRISAGAGEDRVTFAGAVDQPRLIELYREADLAVVPTLNYESFSYTCAQAMAMSLPLVASRIGGIPETVGDGGAACLVEPGNGDELVDKIVWLCGDGGQREKMGRAGRQRAEQYFAADVMAEKTAAYYRKVC